LAKNGDKPVLTGDPGCFTAKYSGLSAKNTPLTIDVDLFEGRKVDDKPMGTTQGQMAVATGANRDFQVVLACKFNSARRVFLVPAPDNGDRARLRSRVPIEHAARTIIAAFIRQDELPLKLRAQLFESARTDGAAIRAEMPTNADNATNAARQCGGSPEELASGGLAHGDLKVVGKTERRSGFGPPYMKGIRKT
jgi:hypothetical protein